MRRIAQDDGVSLMQAKTVNELLNIYRNDKSGYFRINPPRQAGA